MTSPFRVTLNYRRDDSSGHAGRLYDALAEKFGSEHVFMDIDAIEPGIDFGEAIDRALASADAFICLIGRDWLGATDAQGRRRLDNAGDFVRLEIEAALKREIRVIPVLVRDAEMPQSDELPESLSGLARRNAIEIRDNSWHYDVGRLVRTLEKIDRERVDALEPQAADRQPSTTEVQKPRAAAPEPAAAAEQAILSHPAVKETPVEPLGVRARVRRLSTAKKLLAVGGVVALAVALLGGGLLVTRSTEPTLEEWRTDAEDICRRTNQTLRQLGTPGDDAAANVDLLRRAVPITTESTNQLRALEAPSSDAPQIDRYLGLLDAWNELAHDVLQAWDGGDTATLESARVQLDEVDQSSMAAAAELGADDCAEPAFG